MIRAMHQNSTIGALWNFIQGDIVYGHLAAFNRHGYELAVSYALDKFAIEYFSDKARWLNLGGGEGIKVNREDGLTQYKQGWATDTRIAYFCGRIFDQDKYAEIVKLRGISQTDYFPAYRRGEFS
jgi:hypothetical protein